jgi:WD40 repeat protein
MDGFVIIWDLNKKQQRFKLKHDAGVVKIRWHPTDPVLYTACLDGAMRAWNGLSGELLRTWRGHQMAILDFVLTASGDKLITCGEDQVCLVFDAKPVPAAGALPASTGAASVAAATAAP